ncbi:unnamed protein product [Pseudo-nitzschia multistriata]|uniref:subtilisin n=1 Tax=Pseudo-nitzschia multistriata TaxID=183589 RepID=A0A448Z2G4_9STRA|nr:unnamed protein product [Pseudo-nitzschia multistriata]
MKVTSPQLPTIRDQLPGRRSLSFYYYCSLFLFLSIASAPKTIVVVDASPIVKHQERNSNNNQSPYRFEPSYGDQSWIFETINLPGAWKLGYTGRGVKIRINDEDWESGHKEWKPKRLIKDNKNALDDYSCGATNNTLAEGKFRDSDNKNKFLNHGAAVTSILAADGSNDFCGVGIAPETELSFCYFRKDTDASVLKYDAVDNMNFFYISVNAFAQEGCKPRTSMFGEAVNEQTIATGNGDRNRQRRRTKNRHGRQHRQQQDQSDRILNEQEIGGCPFVNFYYDEYNPGDDPCKVCTTSDFKSVRDSNNENARNNFGSLQDQSVNLEESRSGSFTGAGVSNVCAESVRTYCLRNFRKDESLCTDWIDVLNGNKPCDFQTSVGHSVAKALEKGVKDGRFGRGIIYIFAAGNSYGYGDNSNFQSYAKSRYAMTVGAVKVTEVQGDSTDGETNTILKPSHASYSTGGSSIFVVAPGGDYDTPKYQHIGAGGTEGNGDSCVTIGTGTSFAAPVVGGVVALMLEANPGLTWRDVRYIIAKTSNPIDNDDSNDYTFGLNSAGVGYSDLYGFGLIDAAEAVAMAEDWKIKDVHVPPELGVTASSGPVNLQIVDDPTATATSTIMVNPNLNSQTEDDALESVSVYLKLHYPNIGQLRITLTSPLGTTSLLSPGGRSHHNQLEDDEWLEFLTLRSWGEVPYGEWKLSITDTKPGNGGVTCFNRPINVAPEFANLDLPLTCMEFKSSGFCSNGSMNDDLVNEQQELYQKLLDEGSGDGVVSAKESCCECGGGIKFGDDEFFTGQLKEWKLILGDGTPITGTNRIANYDPFLPEVTSFEFMRCRGETVYGHKLDCCNGLEDICDLRN